MNLHRMHVLIPIDECTIEAGVFDVKRKLEESLKAHKIENEIKLVETGTIGINEKGVILTLFPGKIHYYNVKKEDVDKIVEEHFIKGRVVKEIEHDSMGVIDSFANKKKQTFGLTRQQKRVVLDRCSEVNTYDIEEVIAAGAYRAVEKIFSTNISPEKIVEEIKSSGLRGRGGAGFPTGLKWGFTATAKGDMKYIICNADEGEPGTFKDRLILEGDPHKLIEGMMIGAYAIGASMGYIYIRGEYELSIQRTQKAIEDARKYGLLGENIFESGFNFNIEIKKGAGAYVCGEETALIESLEGGRGNPRVKPPFPANKGLWQLPTCVNNVETLANVPDIIYHGADWYKGFGTEQCPGTKVFTILGNVEYPGLIEVEMGTTLRDIVYNYAGGIKGGKKFKGALVGGAAGVFLSDKDLDTKMDYESLKENAAALGSGAILVMDESASIVDMLYSVIHFFEHESCGQCSPCRIGTKQLYDMVVSFKNGEGSEQELNDMQSISDVMLNTSLCPLGQSLVMPVKSAIENFKDEFKTKYKEKSINLSKRRKI